MKKIKNLFMLAAVAMVTTTASAQTEKTVMVGGAAMYPSKNIVENAVNSKDHTTLVAAVKAATEVTALAITKLDGTAKGGVVIAIADQFKIPVKFIGLGEKMEDLLVFDGHQFVNGLF